MTLPIINQIILILSITVAVAALLHRFNIPTILLYLVIGLIAGPNALGIVNHPENYHFVAEFGVAFLLFTLGLEFSLPRLWALRRTVFAMGSLQMAICLAVFSVLIYLYGVPIEGTLVTAAAIALSSTAIVTKELATVNQVNTRHGQIAVGILLFQDIAAVILLVFITAGGQDTGQSIWGSLGWTLLKGFAYFFALVLIGKFLLPPLFHRISQAKSEELFVLTTLTVALTAAGMSHFFGLAMALGAFMAGMMLGESHFRHQIENEIRPFRDVLLGLFFVTIGFMLDVELITEYWPRILFFTACLIIFKTVLISGICMLMGDTRTNSVRAGIILCQGGEFGFALIAIGLKGELIPADVSSFFVSIIVLSMAATPFFVKNISLISDRLLGLHLNLDVSQANHHQPIEDQKDIEDHVVILGYGRVGQMIGRFLSQESIPYIALDDDPVRVNKAKSAGDNVFFGNAKHPAMLKKLGAEKASLVIFSFNDLASIITITKTLREMELKLPIIARQNDDTHAQTLLDIGVTEVIPEVNETTMMIVSHVMAALDVPAEKVEHLLQQTREARYSLIKGYFMGKKTQPTKSVEDSELILHPIYIPQGAWSVNQTISAMNLSEHNVEVQVIRRSHRTLASPYGDLTIQRGDILVIQGRPSQVEAAEAYLLTGV